MRTFFRIIWQLAETLHIPLGRFAPYVFGKMIGSKPVEIDDLGNPLSPSSK